MTDDAIERIAGFHVAVLSADIEEQLTRPAGVKGFRPVVGALHLARGAATAALTSLALVDPTNTEEIRKLQNEVRRFEDLCNYFAKILRDGMEIDVGDDEREFVASLVMPSEAERAEAIRLRADQTRDE